MKHIFLVGFAGTGKTTYGKQLAKDLEWPFADLDERIEQMAGKTIPEIFEQEGESAFRTLERDALNQLIEESGVPHVIATGGGTPCFFSNMNTMKTHGLVVYLAADAQKIKENLEKSTKMGHVRPLFRAENGEISLGQIKKILNDRIHYYEQSHAICGIEGLKSSDLLTIVADLLTKSTQ